MVERTDSPRLSSVPHTCTVECIHACTHIHIKKKKKRKKGTHDFGAFVSGCVGCHVEQAATLAKSSHNKSQSWVLMDSMPFYAIGVVGWGCWTNSRAWTETERPKSVPDTSPLACRLPANHLVVGSRHLRSLSLSRGLALLKSQPLHLPPHCVIHDGDCTVEGNI